MNNETPLQEAISALKSQYGQDLFAKPALKNKKPKGLVKKIEIRNYKSIKQTTVILTSLTILVGINGSGKTNFLDAFGFIAEALRDRIDFAINSRGGFDSIVRGDNKRMSSFFSLKIDFELDNGHLYSYKIRIKRNRYPGYSIDSEELLSKSGVHFKSKSGKLVDFSGNSPPAITSNGLHLATFSGLEEFSKVFDFLSNIRLYSPNVEAMRTLSLPDSSLLLSRGAENVSSLLESIDRRGPKAKIMNYLRKINPVITSFAKRKYGKMETVMFASRHNRYYLSADSVSDGTLRAFAILIAIFQDESEGSPKLSLIGIEEPEAGLHPAAASVLMEALTVASKGKQILITTHSSDILESVDVNTNNIIYTSMTSDGTTNFVSINEKTKEIIRRGLYNPGELFKMGQLI